MTKVIGQRKLLKQAVPVAAHAAAFWGFIILVFTIIKAYGGLFSRTFTIPGIGHSIAMSRARLSPSLALELCRRSGGTGAAALLGGGRGDALILRVPEAGTR